MGMQDKSILTRSCAIQGDGYLVTCRVSKRELRSRAGLLAKESTSSIESPASSGADVIVDVMVDNHMATPIS
jgi:hypothetical protein